MAFRVEMGSVPGVSAPESGVATVTFCSLRMDTRSYCTTLKQQSTAQRKHSHNTTAIAAYDYVVYPLLSCGSNFTGREMTSSPFVSLSLPLSISLWFLSLFLSGFPLSLSLSPSLLLVMANAASESELKGECRVLELSDVAPSTPQLYRLSAGNPKRIPQKNTPKTTAS